MAEVLQVAVVGPDDDFFELGGDSLRVLRLLGLLEQDLGAVLSLADVFAAPTPSGLASLVADDSRADAPDAEPGTDTGELLTLRGGSPGVPPLILLPPAGGLGWCYTGLLRSLPRTQGVHVVQAPGLTEGRPEVVADLGALAARQLATIRGLVGRARFHVAGWSLGGMAAHAVAARARDEGQPVGAVVLLDAYPSDQWRHLAEPTEAEALVGVLRLGGIEAPAGVRLDRDTAVELLRTSGSAVGRLPERVLAGCVASVVEAARLVRTSQHRVLPGDLTVLVAGAPRAETWLDPAGWTPYVGGEVRTVRVDATHGDLVRRPAVDEVGSVLAELLVTDAPMAGTLVARPS